MAFEVWRGWDLGVPLVEGALVREVESEGDEGCWWRYLPI